MANRTIIRTETYHPEVGQPHIIFALEEAQHVHQSSGTRQLVLDLTVPPFSELRSVPPGQSDPIGNNLVKTAGEKITTALYANQDVKLAIDASVASASDDPSPICIFLRNIGAEAIPWELLYHQQGKFLSLDERWPIIRLCGRADPDTVLTYEERVRIVLVISAANRSPLPEWNNFYSALTASGLPYQLNVMVADDSLKNLIEGLSDEFTSVEFVPVDALDLADRLKELSPQILHFFCHGSSKKGGFLEIAGRDGGILDAPPIQLSASRFRSLKEHLWLVSLNACEGATPTHDMQSMAYDIMMGGAPAVIAMRESIDALDANVFCGSFFKSAFKWLANELSTKEQVAIDWTPMLNRTRLKLLASENSGDGGAQSRAENSKSWSIPILYQQPQPIQIVVVEDTSLSQEEIADLVVELESFQLVRAGLPAGTPQGFIDNIDETIAAIETKLAEAASGTSD